MSFGKRLRELRQKYGLSMDELGRKIGTKSSRISDWENEKTTPRSDFVVTASDFFEVTTDWLLKGTEHRGKMKFLNTDYDIAQLEKELSNDEKIFLSEYVNFAIMRKSQNVNDRGHQKSERIYKLNTKRKENESVASEVKEIREVTATKIPVLGAAAAGVPIEVIRFVEGYLEVPEKYSNCFSVRVKGNSMIKAGIKDGGFVIVRQQEYVDNNEIALVMVDNHVTIKRFRLETGVAVLVSENDDIEPMVYNNDCDVRILGKVLDWISPEAAECLYVQNFS
ncbi:S24 family peptidase [Bacillus sp. CGMCC 1.16541]|uniref:helix-turn-helix domain-containing protein n=1 Tax=Bacillus sp. CGMCC 1.16541 TaxID=2185143 RepID=UPI0013A5AC98|nr:S24 family peptidase [Bacillus sp. CGMCC 1.16541]